MQGRCEIGIGCCFFCNQGAVSFALLLCDLLVGNEMVELVQGFCADGEVLNCGRDGGVSSELVECVYAELEQGDLDRLEAIHGFWVWCRLPYRKIVSLFQAPAVRFVKVTCNFVDDVAG